MAQGLAGTWGVETQSDPVRQVGRLAASHALAHTLFKKGTSAAELDTMDDATWASVAGDNADRTYVKNVLRAYENYG